MVAVAQHSFAVVADDNASVWIAFVVAVWTFVPWHDVSLPQCAGWLAGSRSGCHVLRSKL